MTCIPSPTSCRVPSRPEIALWSLALAAAVGVFLVLLSRDMGWLTWLW